MRLAPTVVFEAIGGDPGAFLTASRNCGLPIREFQKQDGVCYGEISAFRYRKAARLAGKYKLRLRVRERRGLYFKLYRYRRRVGLCGGILLFFALLLFSQCFIWAIDVTPTQAVTEQQVRDVLKSHGIHTGTFLPAADLKTVTLFARTELPGLSFFTLNRIGSRIQVEMVDAVLPPETKEGSGPCNIVASKTGLIRSVEAYRGQKMIRVNQSVYEGDLLVSGVVENADGRTSYQRADAVVMAETRTEKEFSLKLKQTVWTQTGEMKVRYRMDLFGKKLPLFLAFPVKEPYDSVRTFFEPQIGPLHLPIGIEREELRFKKEETVSFTEEEALGLLEGMAKAYEEELGMEVLGREPAATVENGKMTLKIVYTFLENIAKPKPFEISEAVGREPAS